MKELTFKKEENKWYIDIPWDGDQADLEMVEGADILLEALSEGLDFVIINISLEPFEDATLLTLIKSDDIGAHYGVENFQLNNVPYVMVSGKMQFPSAFKQFFDAPMIWLCNVTLHVLGSFPDEIYFKKVPNSEVLYNI